MRINRPVIAAVLVLAAAMPLSAQTANRPASSAQPSPPTESVVTQHASGTFEVKLAPQTTAEPTLGRLTIDKQFHGDLEAVSKGEMLAIGTGVQNSAGYVAMERVTGTLAGRTGSFALQHSGTMNRGEASLTVTVVPDSGTDGLAGISGSMTIDMTGGGHRYEFSYTLPASH